MIVWFMGWPSGIKLNDELDRFFGELFLWLIQSWSSKVLNHYSPYSDATMPIKDYAKIYVEFIGISGVLGASTIFALAADTISIMTLHVYWFYMTTARIFQVHLSVLYSLFNLFRGIKCFLFLGKKRNMLRNRIDNADFELSQLLIGTILFTFLIAIFPTVALYYALFAVVNYQFVYLVSI